MENKKFEYTKKLLANALKEELANEAGNYLLELSSEEHTESLEHVGKIFDEIFFGDEPTDRIAELMEVFALLEIMSKKKKKADFDTIIDQLRKKYYGI